MPRGTLVVADVVLPVVEVKLHAGKFIVVGHGHGPFKALEWGNYEARVHSDDGQVVVHCLFREIGWHKIDSDATLTIELPCEITEVMGESALPEWKVT